MANEKKSFGHDFDLEKHILLILGALCTILIGIIIVSTYFGISFMGKPLA